MSDKQFNVNRRIGTVTIPTSDTVVVGTTTQVTNGLCRWLEFLTPAMEGTDSTQLDIVSSAGGTLYTSGTVAESTRTAAGTVFPVQGTISVTATAEGTQSAERDVVYDIYYTT